MDVLTFDDARALTIDGFLSRANSGARNRLFTRNDYADFRAALDEAAGAPGMLYYATQDAGCVANSYGYTTSTAQWGVWREPGSQQVVAVVGRADIRGRAVPCPRRGGETAYRRDWHRAHGLAVRP